MGHRKTGKKGGQVCQVNFINFVLLVIAKKQDQFSQQKTNLNHNTALDEVIKIHNATATSVKLFDKNVIESLR